MAQSIEDIKWLYSKLTSKGYEIGNEVEFTQSLANQEDRDWYYDKAVDMGLNVGSKDDFNALFAPTAVNVADGTNKPNGTPETVADDENAFAKGWQEHKAPALGVVVSDNKADRTNETNRADEPAGSGQWEPTEQERITMSQRINGIVSDFDKRSKERVEGMRRKSDLYSPEGHQMLKVREMQAQMAGTPVKVAGLTPTMSTEQHDGPQGEQPKAGGGQGPVVHGVKYVDGKPVTEWMLPDGTLTTSLLEADNAEYNARGERLIHERDKRMRDAGLDPNKAEDVQLHTVRERIAHNEERLKRLYKERDDRENEPRDDESGWERFVRLTGGAARRSVETHTPQPRSAETPIDKDIKNLLAENSLLENARRTLESGKKLSKSDGWLNGLLDFGNNAKNVLRGATDTLQNPDLYGGGVVAMHNAERLNIIADKVKNNESLSNSELALAYASMLNTQATSDTKLPHGYKAGRTTTEMVPFMLQMALNPASGLSRGIVKKYGTSALKRIALTAAGDIAEAGVLANTLQGLKTAADINDRHRGETVTDGKDVRFEGGEDWSSAIRKGEGAAVIENYTELLGGHFGKILAGAGRGVSKGLTAAGAGRVVDRVSKFIGGIKASDWGKAIGNIEQRAQWNGTLGEIMEEEAGLVLNSLFVGDNKLSDLTDMEQQIDIVLGVGLFGGFVSGIKTGGYLYGSRKANMELRKADRAGGISLGDGWQRIKDRIDGAEDSDISSEIRNITSESELTREQLGSVMKYAYALQKSRGYNNAYVNRMAEASELPENDKDAATVRAEGEAAAEYDNGMAIYDAYDEGDAAAKNDIDEIGRRMHKAYQDVEDAFGAEAEYYMFHLNENPWGLLNDPELTIEQQDAVMEYINARAALEGVMDASNESAERKRAAVKRSVERRTHNKSNVIIPATMKVGDRQVYVVSGDVVMFPDGSGVDRSSSSESVIVMDAETGEYEFTSPELIHNISESIDPQVEMHSAFEAIEQERLGGLPGDGGISEDMSGEISENSVNSQYGNGSEQDNDERAQSREDDGSRMATDTAGATQESRDRSDIRVYEEGLAASRDAHSEHSERNRREAESERLVGIARQQGQYVDRSEYANLGEKQLKRTGESEVYINETERKVYKIKDPAAKSPMKGGVQPEDAIYEHLVHNKYFPETRYQFEGVSDDMGDLRIVLSQEYIDSYGQPTQSQIEAALAEKGLKPEGRYSYGNDEISVTDVTGDNALLGADGKVYFIDPIINFKKPVREIIGEVPVDTEAPDSSLDESRMDTVNNDSKVINEGAANVESALSRIPIDEATQEPDFTAVDKETAWDGLVEAVGSDKDAAEIVGAQVRQAMAEHESLKKNKPTLKAPKLSGSPMAMAKAKREAAEEYEREIEEYGRKLEGVQNRIDAWNSIAGVYASRNAELKRQQEARKAQIAAEEHTAAMARFEEGQRIKAEKQAEAERLGIHAVNPRIKEKWDSANKVDGLADAITLPDGSTIRGRYVLTEAGAASASLDVNNAYEPTEGFPVDTNGQSVNDRDYLRDKDAQRIVEQMAGAYDNRALQNPVIVSQDGVVLSGNNRTMSGDLAARQGTDKAYIDYLREFGQKYGFTPEQVRGMEHPRLVFVPDEALPYDATTFSRFNAQEMKSQSKPEAAVKLGKIVPDDVFSDIVSDISRYDRLADYYADEKAVAYTLGALMQAGVINDKQMPEMRTGTALSAAGKELIENTLIGKVFQTSPDAVRQIISMPTLRQSIVMGLNEIAENIRLGQLKGAENRTLARNGYDLSEELSKAVDLVTRAKAAMPDVYTDGMPVSPFGRMQGLFDDEYGDSRVTDATTLLLADLLNSGKPSDLRKVLTTYNNEASQSASGQADIFTGEVPTKENILIDVIKIFNNGTAKEKRKLVDAAIAGRKKRAEGIQERGGSSPMEQVESTGQSSEGREKRTGFAGDAGRNGERADNLQPQASGYRLSDEVDENGRQFVLTTSGELEFGQINDVEGLETAPILLSEGIITNPATNDGYGLVHIEARHGEQIRGLGYTSVLDFIEEVAKNYNTIRKGTVRDGKQTYMLQLTDKHNNTLMVELSTDGSYYTINTAGAFKTSYGNNREIVYNRHTTVNQPAEIDEASQNAQQSGTNVFSSMNTPALPSRKVNDFASDKQDSSEESFGKFHTETQLPLDKPAGRFVSADKSRNENKITVEPTEAQKAAGNYKMEHRRIDGYNISIENPKGSVRRGKDSAGKEWQTEMHNDYGYIRGTEGVDGDHIDVFLSDTPEEGDVFVIDQRNEDGSFDEHKVMYGFPSEEAAREAYLSNYEEGWGGLGAITQVSKDEFKKWVQSSKRKTKPFSEYKSVKQTAAIEPIGYGDFGPIFTQFRGDAQGAIRKLTELKAGEAIGALHHKDVGDIDIVWGIEGTGHSDGMGLAKLVKYHPEVIEHLQEILDDMVIVKRTDNRINLESQTHKAAVRLTWNNEAKKWLLTAFEKKETPKSIDKTTDTGDNPSDLQGDTALLQNSGVSDSKDNSFSADKQVAGAGRSTNSVKIEDFGEKIAGARKDMLGAIAKTVENATVQSLVELPISKAFKRPNLKKMVEEGVIGEDEALLAEAVMQSMIYGKKKPVATGRMSRKREILEWAQGTHNGIKLLGEILSGDDERKDKALAEHKRELAERVAKANDHIRKMREWNPEQAFEDVSELPDELEVMRRVLKGINYRVGDKINLPLSKIEPSSTYQSFNVDSASKQGALWFRRSHKSVDEAVNIMIFAAKIARGDMDLELPGDLYLIKGVGKPIEVATGNFEVRYLGGKDGVSVISKIFTSEDAAKKYATEKSGKVYPETRYTGEYNEYAVSVKNPITGNRHIIGETFSSRGEAALWQEEHRDEVNMKGLEAINKEMGVKGQSREHFYVDSSWDRNSKSVRYFVIEDDKHNPWPIVKDFSSRAEAEAWLKDNMSLLETKRKAKRDAMRNVVYFENANGVRSGEDWRKGQNANAEMYDATFGFRGVQFGNWTNDADRQAALNEAYDALMDMSKALGISPKAISLDGELGLAFGARGGGLASAHYEPVQVVINLTKTRGAGSLAHEWWHALDNYLSRRGGVAMGYVTHDNGKDRLNPDVADALKGLMSVLNHSAYSKRSVEKGDYWGRGTELTARLFETWIAERLRKSGVHTPFLAVMPSEKAKTLYQELNYESYKANEELTASRERREPKYESLEEFKARPESLNGYPYPTMEELAQFDNLMDGFVKALATREEETGSMATEPKGRYQRKKSNVAGRSLFDWADNKAERNMSHSEEANAAETANRTIDDYVEVYKRYLDESTALEEQLANVNAESEERVDLEERLSHEEALAIEARRQMEDTLREFYLRDNTPEDASRIASQMVERIETEVAVVQNREALLHDVLNSSPEVEKLMSKPETVSEARVQTAGGTISYEGKGHMPDGKRGEFAYVERKFSRSGEFDFTGGDRIESRADVAYMFRSLCDYSIEHVFGALVKDGKVKVIHIGMGGPAASYANLGALRAAYDAFGADKVYLVHNHPSGNLRTSGPDEKLLDRLKQGFENTSVEIEGLIMDTTSGRYMRFGGAERAGEEELPTGVSGKEEGVDVLRFDRQTYVAHEQEMPKMSSSGSVIAFINEHRRGDGGTSYIVLAHNMQVVGHFHTDSKSSDVDELSQELVSAGLKYGGSAVILYGDHGLRDVDVRRLEGQVKAASMDGLRLLDVLKVSGQHWKSAQDEGLMRESEEKYGTGPSGNENMTDSQGNPIDAQGRYIVENVESISEITDGDFMAPTRNVGLPALPEIVQQVLSTNGKRVIIKKNIFERNARRHDELTPEMSRTILTKALYNPTFYGKNKPLSRPNNWIVINLPDGKGNNKLVVLEINESKNNVEIVHWHEADKRGLEKIKKQAEREDGQLLILPYETSEEAGALSGPTFDSPSKGKVTKKNNKNQVKHKHPSATDISSLSEALKAITLDDDSEDTPTSGDGNKYRLVEDKELLDFLDGQPLKLGYRYAQWANMGVLPPMTAKQNGEWRAPMVFSRWEQSEEGMRKDNGKADLVQGNGRTTGGVAYNPYFHIRTSPLNDQFTAAYDRPELLVVEGYYPESEETCGYRAEGAKDSVGLMDWHSGSVNGQLSDDTKVQTMLSRYFKPRRIVPWSEVADLIMERVGDQRITFPINAVPPMLRAELAKRGAKFGDISGSVAEADIPMLNDLRDRVNAGEWDAGLERAREYMDAYESSSEAKKARVETLSRSLHTPIRVISDQAEIDALPTRRQRRAKGWWSSEDNGVVIVMPNNVNVADVDNTVVHEVVGHKGLRAFIGAERFDNFLREVYDHASESIRKVIDKMTDNMVTAEADRLRVRKSIAHEHAGEDANSYYYTDMAEARVEAERKREQFRKEATEEYMSDLGGRIGSEGFEKMSRDEMTLWGKIKAKVQQFLDKFLQGLKIAKSIRLTDKDLAYILYKSWKNLRDVRTGHADVFSEAEDVVMRRRNGWDSELETRIKSEAAIERDNRLFNRDLARYINGSMSVQEFISVGKPQGVMRIFLSDVPIVMRQRILHKASVTKHNIDLSQLQDLPEKLAKPIFVFQRDENTLGVLTELKDRDGKNVCVAIELNRTIQSGSEILEVNDIRSLHGRDAANIVLPVVHNNTMKYADKEKGLAWLSSASSNYQQEITAQDLESAAKVINSFENPKYDENAAIRFRDPGMGLEETITKMKTEVMQANAGNLQAKRDAMQAIGGNLNHLRQAMARQREYDITTVKSVADLAKVLLEANLLDDLSKHETKRILGVINNVVGKEDVSKYVQKEMDIMVDNQMRMGANTFGRLLSIRGSRVDARGIEVQGELDPEGQQIAQVVRKATSLAKDDIDKRMLDMLDRMGSTDKTIADNAAIEYAGLQIARQYVEDITESKAEEKALRDSIKQAKEDKDAGQMTATAYRQYVASTEDAIRQNKIERAEAYRGLVDQLGGVLQESAERARLWREAEKKRIGDIQHNANSDMEGRPADEHHKENRIQKILNSSLTRFFLAPLGTFDQMLRMFGRKNVRGEGYLWNHYMRGWTEATEKEYTGYREALKVLDDKVREVFKDSKDFKARSWGDLFSIDRKLPKASVSFWDGGEMKDHELTQGNLLYIYMVDKMSDGRMKLRHMGITDEDIEKIKNFLDPRFIELADWMQDEFLVDKRNEYNEVHKRMFGASMAAIENYFPLKILANARLENVDVADDAADNVLPATSTGSIIKRRRNNLALDVTGANAFSVILDHLQQMERWAAFAEFNRDLNTLLSYKRFRNQVMNMSSVYGAGKTLWNNFRNVCSMAAGAYRPPIAPLDKAAVNIAKGVTAAKVSFRMFTALKQFLSMPAYLPDSNPMYLAANIANPIGAWRWAMENLPIFDKRWSSRLAGDPRLMKTDMDWKMWRSRVVDLASRVGMSPNAFVDALTVSIGARSMYQTKLAKYKRMGYGEAEAEKRAKQDATILFNQTQQSSEGAFLSTMQVDRSWLNVLFTVFRNSSMSYTRQLYDAMRNIGHHLTPGYKEQSIEYMAKQLKRDGIDPDTADRNAKKEYWRSLMRDFVRVGVFGYLMQLAWNMGGYLLYMLLGDDENEKGRMWEDVLNHTMFGSIEGLTGGDVMSAAGQMWANGEWNPQYLAKDMPLASDVMSILKKWDKDQVSALNDVVNLLVQSGLGVNPQSLTDAAVAIWDYCGDDVQTSRECALLIARIFNCPQSQIDKILDELDATAREASEMTPAEIAERYARYKMMRSAPLTGWMRSDQERDSVTDRLKKPVLKLAKEKINARVVTEETRRLLDEYETVAKEKARLGKMKDEDPEGYYHGIQELYEQHNMGQHRRVGRYRHDMKLLTEEYLRCNDVSKLREIADRMERCREQMLEDVMM